ncbi:MAG: HlyD family efflux transporter periplasmic adaptor subunit [Bdellovibrionaceae bacterium]|nr:HlyD family efflux transporter periplasmic adaptor subunit [Pseudobdellovibrionaceae bacterium]
MKSIKKLITIIQEDIVGTDNRYMAMVWAACLAGVVALSFYMGSESMSFLGVADSRELQVNFESPVEIKRIHVLAGQMVKKGDLLIELNQSELNSRLRLARSQMAKLQSEMKVRQHLNSIVSNSSSVDLADPLAVDIEDLGQEIEYLELQKKNLYVFAEVDGIVGAVNFKKGEKVPAFTSVLTLSPANPSYVEGFVHENLQTKLEIGKTVSVVPLTRGHATLQGKIVSVGSRIILMPPRLMHFPNVQIWGREVVVEIPSQNGLLLGEKVQIKPKFELFSFPIAVAATETASAAAIAEPEMAPQAMHLPSGLGRRYSFEPSGVLYLEDLKKYLIVSDDTDKKKSATLFLADRDGKVDDQVLTVAGLDKISDLESISQSGDSIYILASQGLTKKGKEKSERNLFVEIKRSGLDLSVVGQVELKPLLIKAIKAGQDKALQALLKSADEDDFEIESHFVDGGDLYLGFKEPFLEGDKTAIVVVKGVDALLKTKTLKSENVALWKALDFGKNQGQSQRLSDLIKIKGRLYAATVCDDENCGAVWRLQENQGVVTPELIREFKGLKPEGLALDTKDSSLFVAFDLKDETAKFTRLSLQNAVKAPAKKNEK